MPHVSLHDPPSASERENVANELRRSEERLLLATEAANLGTWDWDIGSRRLLWSPRCLAIFGLAPGDAMAYEDFLQTLHPEDRDRVALAVRTALHLRHDYEVEFRCVWPDGSVHWIASKGRGYYDDSGRPVRMSGVAYDITDKKETERALRLSERTYRAIFQQAAIGIARVSFKDARCLEVNDAFCRMLGYSKEFLRSTPWPEITHPDDIEIDLVPFRRMAAGELDSYTIEKRFIHRHRHFVWARLTLSLVRDLHGNPDYEIAIIENIDRRKRAEALLQRQAHLIDLSPTATIVRKPQGEILFWSAGAEKLYGWTAQEALGRLTHDLFQTQFPIPLSEITNNVQSHGQWSGELRHRTKDGRTVVVESQWLGQYDAAGQLVELLESNTDQTERQRTLEQLRASEERMRKALATPTIGVLFFTLDGRISEANAAMQRMCGYSGTELRKLGWKTLTAPEFQNITLGHASELMHRGETQPFEKQMVRKNGSRWWGLFALVKLSGSGPATECMEFTIDISDLKHTEAALQRRTEHLSILHRATADLLLGRPPQELLNSLYHQISRNFGIDVFTLYQLGKNGAPRLELKAFAGLTDTERHKLENLCYGRAICVKDSQARQPIIVTHIQQQHAPHQRFLRKLGLQSYLYYPLMIDGQLRGTLAFASRTRADFDSADLDFFQTFARTVNESLDHQRLESEVQAYTARLEQEVKERTARLRETVSELEGFSYSLVHDMRGPLRAMLAYAEILELEAGPRLKSDETDLLRKIGLAARRMDHLVTDSLNFSKILRQDLPLGRIDLGALLRGMLDTYPNLHAPLADVQIEFDHLYVLGNEAALIQIFSNLLGNAVKFVAPGVHPRVRVWVETRDCPETLPNSISGPAQLCASVFVEDNGIGIPEDAHDKIFGMFTRMHRADEYPGTGIGLALVKKSLERTGGQITLKSEPGKGSRFCVELPLSEPATETAAEAA